MSKKSPTSKDDDESISLVPADLVQSRKVPLDPSSSLTQAEGAASVRGFHQSRKGPAWSLSPVRWRELKEGAASVRSIGRKSERGTGLRRYPRTHFLRNGNPGHFGAVRGASKKRNLFPGGVRIERVLGTPERRPLPGDVRCLARRIPCVWEGADCSSLPRNTDDAHS